MPNTLLVPELREILHTGKKEELQFFLEDIHPALAAEFLAALEIPELIQILDWLEIGLATDIFTNLPREDQISIIKKAKTDEIGDILDLMPPDDRADLFNELDEDEQEKMLPAMDSEEREDLEHLAAYPEGTAGSVMTTDFITLSPSMTAAVLPLSAARLKLDPALIASPALTTVVDITGLLIYFNIASYLLNL